MFIEFERALNFPRPQMQTAGPFLVFPLLEQNFWPVISGRLAMPGAIYAALWERTGAFDVLRDAVESVLGSPDVGGLGLLGLQQAEMTASLLLRDPPAGTALAVTTSSRPDADAIRHSLYQRLFGPLVGPVDAQEPADEEFPRSLNDLLQLGLAGAANRLNIAGANPTQLATVAQGARRIRRQLELTRPAGMLMSREEFAAVALAGWVELTFDDNSPLLMDLGATGNTPAQRIQRLASATGQDYDAVDPLVADLIDAARPASNLVRSIELGTFEAAPATLWTNVPSRVAVEIVADVWSQLAADEPALPAGTERLQLRIAS
jgi:hypothetical protein